MKDEYDFSDAKRGSIVDMEGKVKITLVLDTELLARIREHADDSGESINKVVNDLLYYALLC